MTEHVAPAQGQGEPVAWRDAFDECTCGQTCVLHPAPAVSLPEDAAVPCPCTTYEQDESCPVGYPSQLCWACGGIGRAYIEKVVQLAAEMMRIADQAGETEDPFAAWETLHPDRAEQAEAEVARLKSALIAALDNLDGEPEYHQQGMGCGIEDRGITDRYDAMEYGWDQAMERVYGEHINSARELIAAALSPADSKEGE